MTTFNKFHHDLTELVKKYETDLGLKIEEDLEYDIIKIFGKKLLHWLELKMVLTM